MGKQTSRQYGVSLSSPGSTCWIPSAAAGLAHAQMNRGNRPRATLFPPLSFLFSPWRSPVPDGGHRAGGGRCLRQVSSLSNSSLPSWHTRWPGRQLLSPFSFPVPVSLASGEGGAARGYRRDQSLVPHLWVPASPQGAAISLLKPFSSLLISSVSGQGTWVPSWGQRQILTTHHIYTFIFTNAWQLAKLRSMRLSAGPGRFCEGEGARATEWRPGPHEQSHSTAGRGAVSAHHSLDH